MISVPPEVDLVLKISPNPSPNKTPPHNAIIKLAAGSAMDGSAAEGIRGA